jgi:MFS family permease
MTPIGGKLSDIYGRKKMVILIMIIYIVGIFLGGLSYDITFLFFSRIIQGIGIAMFPIAFGIVRDQFPPEKLAIGVGTFSAMFAAGSVVGLAIGGTIIQSFGWRLTFFSIIPLSIILWFVIKKFIDDVRYPHPAQATSLARNGKTFGVSDSENKIRGSIRADDMYGHKNNNSDIKIVTDNGIKSVDIKGAIALAVTITSFLIVLSYMETAFSNNKDIERDQITSVDDAPSYNSSNIVVAFVSIGTISLVIFVVIERRARTPLIEFKLMANRMILASNLLLLISFLSMFTVYQTIPFLVRSPVSTGAFGGDPIATANIQLPFMIVFLVFAPFSGFIISKLGKIRPTLTGSVIASIGFFSIFLFHFTPTLVAGTLAIIATGLSLIQVGAFNIVLESTPRHLSGTSLGTTVLLNLMGGAIGPTIAGIILQMNQISVNGNSGTMGTFPSPQAYYLVFLFTALLSIVSIILVLIIKRNNASQVITR